MTTLYGILKRMANKIGKDVGNISIQDILSPGFKLSDLQWLFMDLFERISERQVPSDIISKCLSNRFVQPSGISLSQLLQFDKNALDIAEERGFTSVVMPPVSILGTSSALTPIKQRNIMSTVRMTEVTADIATALAVESSRRRKMQCPRGDDINICSSQRIIRLQKFSDDLGFTPHFQMFGLCSLGRYRVDNALEFEYLANHIQTYLEMALMDANAYGVNNITVAISDMQITEAIIARKNIDRTWIRKNTEDESFDFIRESEINLTRLYGSIQDVTPEIVERFKINGRVSFLREVEKKVVIPLKRQFPEVNFLFDFGRIMGIGYYPGLCFKIIADNLHSEMYPLADGGLVDWAQKMLSDKKELMLASGFGSELFCSMFNKYRA